MADEQLFTPEEWRDLRRRHDIKPLFGVGSLYVAGPMRGIPLFNFPAFDDAAARLREAGSGIAVVTPADLDRQAGFDPEAPGGGEVDSAFLRAAIQRDVAAVCNSDGVALLPGWERSRGTAVEIATARFLDLPVFGLEMWLRWMQEGLL